jgi:RNA polymerase sigma-70 factor (ECF subfamily)
MGAVPDMKRGMDHRRAPGPTEDERRFRALFDQHFADLWRFARRRCDSADDADDIAAETFAVAWRRRDDLPAGNDARLWLFGTARRVLANQRRSAGRHARLHQRVERTTQTRHAPDPADAIVERASDRLLAALATLTDDDRDLLLMRAWDELSVTDMAALLEVTPNAVSVRLSKARARLALALDPTDPGAPRTGTGRSPHPEGDAS